MLGNSSSELEVPTTICQTNTLMQRNKKPRTNIKEPSVDVEDQEKAFEMNKGGGHDVWWALRESCELLGYTRLQERQNSTGYGGVGTPSYWAVARGFIALLKHSDQFMS